jgi:hypothetical protein
MEVRGENKATGVAIGPTASAPHTNKIDGEEHDTVITPAHSQTDNIKRVAYVVLGVIVLLFLLFLLFTQVGPPVVDFFKRLFGFSPEYHLSDAFGISE